MLDDLGKRDFDRVEEVRDQPDENQIFTIRRDILAILERELDEFLKARGKR